MFALESSQDFLFHLDMKLPCMHLVEISNFSLNNVTFRPTIIMKRADIFLEKKIFQNFHPSPIFFKEIVFGKVGSIFHIEK